MSLEKIFSISNYIYNNIKQNPIDYSNIKSVWINLIGANITLSQEEFNDINSNCILLGKILIRIDYIINIINSLDNLEIKAKYINENASLFDLYFIDHNIALSNIKNKVLRYKDISYSKIDLGKENINRGTEWLYEILDIYLKYEGVRGIPCSKFFSYIKSIWDKISDYDTCVISDITDNILGGISLVNISTNLKDWIIKNSLIIRKEYRDIITLEG